MDEDTVDAIAGCIFAEREFADGGASADIALSNLTYRIAEVINQELPTYDLRYFYRNAGYDRPFPDHPIH